jgi:hypothetical protein
VDLSGYRESVVEHVLIGRARARLLEDVRAGKPWQAFLDRGVMQIGNDTFIATLLGTYSAEEQTFLWSWANPSAEAWKQSIFPLRMIRWFKKKYPGHDLFDEPCIPASVVNPNELAYVTSEMNAQNPVFGGSHDGGAAFFCVPIREIRNELVQRFPLAYIPGVLADLPAITTADPRRCTRRFLDRLGFAVHDDRSSLHATRHDGQVTVAFDAAGRIARATVTTT